MMLRRHDADSAPLLFITLRHAAVATPLMMPMPRFAPAMPLLLIFRYFSITFF